MKVKAGDKFKIVYSRHWGSGKTFTCHRVERHRVAGYDDKLDLGLMVVFWGHFKSPGRAGWHMVPLDWCISLGPAEVLNERAANRTSKRTRKA